MKIIQGGGEMRPRVAAQRHVALANFLDDRAELVRGPFRRG
jgi:hypothetical protein